MQTMYMLIISLPANSFDQYVPTLEYVLYLMCLISVQTSLCACFLSSKLNNGRARNPFQSRSMCSVNTRSGFVCAPIL